MPTVAGRGSSVLWITVFDHLFHLRPQDEFRVLSNVVSVSARSCSRNRPSTRPSGCSAALSRSGTVVANLPINAVESDLDPYRLLRRLATLFTLSFNSGPFVVLLNAPTAFFMHGCDERRGWAATINLFDRGVEDRSTPHELSLFGSSPHHNFSLTDDSYTERPRQSLSVW